MIPMFGLGILETFFILIVLLVFAVVKKRSGVALAVVGALALFLLVPVTLIMLYTLVRFGSHVINDFGGPPSLVTLHAPNSSNIESYTTTWKISFIGMIALLGGLVAFVVAMFRRGPACSTGSGVARWWPLALIPLLPAFFFVGSMESSRHTNRTMGINTYPTSRQESGAGPVAQVHDELTKRIATGDIHELMDQADAPRIVIPEGVTVKKSPKLVVVKSAEATIVTGKEEGAGKAADDAHGEVNPPAEEKPAGERPAEKDEDKDAKESAKDEVRKPEENASSVAKSEVEDESVAEVEQENTPAPPGANASGSPSKDKNRTEKAEQVAAEAKPDWVKNSPKHVGHVQKRVIATEEYSSIEECRKAMDVLLLYATSNHLMNMNGHHFTDQSLPSLTLHNGNVLADGQIIMWNGGTNDYRLSQLNRFGIGIDFIRREIAKDEYVQTTERSVGPMTKLYTLIEFSPAAERELQARYDSYRRHERFAVVGVSAASVLGLLGLVWGLFKFDTMTKGYYTKRLFLGVPAAIIGGWLFLIVLDHFTNLL